jgi:glutamine synthetase type III
MMGYSMTRPTLNQDYFTEIYDQCAKFGIEIEGLHTESGPGVYEVALAYGQALKVADSAHLFKTSVKQLAIKHGIIPCFMAKVYIYLLFCICIDCYWCIGYWLDLFPYCYSPHSPYYHCATPY